MHFPENEKLQRAGRTVRVMGGEMIRSGKEAPPLNSIARVSSLGDAATFDTTASNVTSRWYFAKPEIDEVTG